MNSTIRDSTQGDKVRRRTHMCNGWYIEQECFASMRTQLFHPSRSDDTDSLQKAINPAVRELVSGDCLSHQRRPRRSTTRRSQRPTRAHVHQHLHSEIGRHRLNARYVASGTVGKRCTRPLSPAHDSLPVTLVYGGTHVPERVSGEGFALQAVNA
jgi:hypothetical protein